MNIGEVAKATGVSRRMIRHYEEIGLVPLPARRQSGYRDYGAADIHRLHFVRRSRDLGFSIDEIRTLLALWADRSRASADVKALALEHAAELARKAEELQAMRRTLLSLATHCHGDDRPDCPILEELGARPPGSSLSAGPRS